MDVVLPDLIISSDLIERIQFSVSSRNAEAKVSECATHVFAAPYSDNPHDIKWQYVSSGVTCLLRNRELSNHGRRYVWSMNLCLYNASYGVLVWKAKLFPNSDYTAVADNFHVFALGEVNVLVGLMFSVKEEACGLNTTYTNWNQERMKDDGKKGYVALAAAAEPSRFSKEMISKPCNFQHIQGTQAIDECMDIEKIKSDILATFFGMGTMAGRSEASQPGKNLEKQKSSKKKKKEPVKARLEFREIELPLAQSPTNQNLSPAVSPLGDFPVPMVEGVVGVTGVVNSYSPELNPAQEYNQQGQTYHPTEANGYSSGSFGHIPNQDQRSESSLSQEFSRRGVQTASPPNYQNPSSPAYQEYGADQGTFSPDPFPPRLDMNLEKELNESMLFKPSVTAM